MKSLWVTLKESQTCERGAAAVDGAEGDAEEAEEVEEVTKVIIAYLEFPLKQKISF